MFIYTLKTASVASFPANLEFSLNRQSISYPPCRYYSWPARECPNVFFLSSLCYLLCPYTPSPTNRLYCKKYDGYLHLLEQRRLITNTILQICLLFTASVPYWRMTALIQHVHQPNQDADDLFFLALRERKSCNFLQEKERSHYIQSRTIYPMDHPAGSYEPEGQSTLKHDSPPQSSPLRRRELAYR